MRNGQNNNKRMRGRSNHHQQHRKNQNPLTRVYESNGPDVKIRGTASHVAEKYVQLARDATTSGDPVTAENYHQHAEHYLRLIAAAQEQFRQQNPYYRPEGGETPVDNRDDNFDDGDDGMDQPMQGQPMQGQPNFGNQPPYPPRDSQPPFPPRDSQPYGGRDQQPHQQGRPQHQHHQPQHQQPQHQQPQHQQPQQPAHQQPPQQQQPQNQFAGVDGNDGERLPSFITGGGQPAHNNGPNGGYDNQGGDRYQMHRRRRRHRGHQRPDLQGGPQGVSGNDSPDEPSSGND